MNNSPRLGKDCKSIDNLTVVANSLASANSALKEVIHFRDDEIGRMEHFEEQFCMLRDDFAQLKELADTHDKRAVELQVLLSQELNKHHQVSEDLKRQLSALRREIAQMSLENERLEQDLRDSVEKLQKYEGKLKYSNNNYSDIGYANAILTVSSPYGQRLCEDIK